jgi:hypothetical protein
MTTFNTNEFKDILLDTIESSLEAQLRAVRRLRQVDPLELPGKDKGMSQVDMAFDILTKARRPLHVSVLIERIKQTFGTELDRESLVSALTKKVVKSDRFTRTDKNTFAVR